MNKLLLLIFYFTTICFSYSQVITPFSVRYQTTQKGGIRYLANTASSCTGGASCTSARAENPPAGTSFNNSFSEGYTDIDADAATFQSSSDSLALPSCSEVLWAGLYWGGDLTSGGSNYATRNQCKLKVNNNAYINLTATALQDNNVGYNSYHCFRDVTTLVQNAGINARFTVANVALQVSATNKYGGWSIVVVYKNDLQPMRNLTVFNGLSTVSGANPTTDVTVSGFLTPASGPVTFEVGAISYDGDRGQTGDQMLFNGGGGFIGISDADNNPTDIFNSTLCYNGVAKTAPFINPAYLNTLGFDADIFVPNNAAKNYIGNNVTSATLRLSTGGETYLTQVVTMAIDVYEPDLRASVRVRDINSGMVEPGDTLEYTVAGKNIGSDPSINTFLVDTLEQNGNFVPGSIVITSGANAGVKTDGGSDDQAEFVAGAKKYIKVRIGTGANGTGGGQVNNSPGGNDSTQFKFRVVATTDCVILQCDNVINNRAYIFGTGNVSGNTFNNGSNPGIFDTNGCPIPGTTATPINATVCASPTATSNSPVCAGGSVNLSTVGSNTANYSWTGPNGFTSNLRNPVIPSATVSMAGTYTVNITIPGTVCSFVLSVNVVVNVTAATPAISTNSPVCSGGTINLSTPAVAGASYNWTGPNGFTSGVQNPTITNAVSTMVGSYSVTVTANSCTSAAGSASVTVNAIPATPAISTNSPVCSGGTINLSTPAVAGASYNWTGPNGFTSGVQNPTITNAVSTMGGSYSVTVTANSCTSAAGSASVTVNAIPATPAIYTNSPVCSGGTINLSTPAVAGASYNWTGPNGFTSNAQNPAIANSTIGMAGNYNLTITTNGCTGTAGSAVVNVITTPAAPAITTNSPVCTGGTINLSTPATPGTTFTWTGPNGFTSNLDNPVISNTTNTMGGSYNLVVTENGCTSAGTTASIVVNQTPSVPTIGHNGPLCEGNPVNLSTAAVAGASYGWTGPNGFTSNIQNPTIANATTAMSGNYNVTVTINSCTSAPASASVVVNALPATPSITGNSPVCEGGSIDLSASALTGATYSWTGPNGFTSNIQNPTITNATIVMGGSYTLNVTANGCTSATASGSVIVNDLPVLPSISSNSPVCDGGTVNLSTPAIAGASYKWTGPNGFVSNLQNPTLVNVNAVMAGVYNLVLMVNGCSSANANIIIRIDASITATASNTGPYLERQTVILSTNGPAISWSGPNGFQSNLENPSFLASAAGAGVYKVVVSAGSCKDSALTTVVVNQFPITQNDKFILNEDNSITGSLALNDNTTDGPSQKYSVVRQARNGAATVALSGTFTYVPNLNFNSKDTLIYQLCDGGTPEGCAVDTLFLTVNAVNDAPVVLHETFTTLQGTLLTNTLANGDHDNADGSSVTYTTTPVRNASHGNMVVSSNGNFTFQPNSGYTGKDTIVLAVCDQGLPMPALCIHDTLIITITPSNLQDPVLVKDTAMGDEDQNISGTFLKVNEADPDGTTLVVATTPVKLPQYGIITVTSAGAYNYIPHTNFNGKDTVVVNVCDQGIPARCKNDTLVIIINPVNDPPVAINESFTVFHGSSLSSTLANGDHDNADGMGVNYQIALVKQPANGTMTVTSSGMVNFFTRGNYIGMDTAIFSVCDQGLPLPSLCVNDTVFVNILSSNLLDPIVSNDTAVINEDQRLFKAVLARNAKDPEGTTLIISQQPSRLPLHGTFVVNFTGEYNYIPEPNFHGKDTAVVTVCDQGIPARCVSDTVIITINPVNDAPVAINESFTMLQSTLLNNSLANGDHDNADTTTISYSTTPVKNSKYGNIVVTSNGDFTYEPTAGFLGKDTIVVAVCDQGWPMPSLCVNDTLFITVTPSNLLDPLVTTDTALGNEDEFVKGTILKSNEVDPEGTSLVVLTTPIKQPQHGSIVLTTTGIYTYVPMKNYFGQDTIVVSVCDEGIPARCMNDTLLININPVNDAPAVINENYATQQGIQLTNTFANGDHDNSDGTTVIYSTAPFRNASHGSIIIRSNGSFTYTPVAGYIGKDTVIVAVCDQGLPLPSLCMPDTLVIIITPANLFGPVVTSSTGNGNEDQTLTGALLKSDEVDPDGTVLVVSTTPIRMPQHGSISVSAAGSYSYTPNTNYFGPDTVIVTVCDQGIPAKCSNDTLFIDISPVNDLPITFNEGYATPEGTALSHTFANGDHDDADGTKLLFNTTSPLKYPAHGRIVISNNGDFTYTPTPGYVGRDMIILSACDQGLPMPSRCSVDTLIVTILPALQDSNHIGLAKDVLGPVYKSDGSFDLLYTIYVKNYGNKELVNIQVVDDLEKAFPEATSITVITPPAASRGLMQNSQYNGTTNKNLLLANLSTLPANGMDSITFGINVKTIPGTYANLAVGYYTSNNKLYSDTSTAGKIPDLNGNKSAGDANENKGTITTIPKVDLDIPNGFSPNGDGLNDLFVIEGLDSYPNAGISIFNRWGSLVFKTEKYLNNWDGTSTSDLTIGQAPLPASTYFYLLQLRDSKGTTIKGYIYVNP